MINAIILIHGRVGWLVDFKVTIKRKDFFSVKEESLFGKI